MVPSEGVIAISGGNGGIGLVYANWLLDKASEQVSSSGDNYKPTFEIHCLSRSAKVLDVNLHMWEEAQRKATALGLTVKQGKIDMSSQESVDQWVSSVSPNLAGFIHSAGLISDIPLKTMTPDEIEKLYASKTFPALYLHDAFEKISNPKMQFYWLFSSTSAYGSMNQAAYAASNSGLDALARHRVALGKPTKVIHWGAWAEVGMMTQLDDATMAKFNAGPQPAFSNKQALQGFQVGLRSGLPEFYVLSVNMPVMYNICKKAPGNLAVNKRYFFAGFLPGFLPTSFDQSDTYDIYSMLRYLCAQNLKEDASDCCVFNHYVMPRAEARKPRALEDTPEVVEVGFI